MQPDDEMQAELKMHRRREGGFTLIELGIAIAIAVILGIVALGVYASVHSRSNTYTASTNLTALASAIRSDYHGNFTGIAIEQLINAGDVPKVMITSDTALHNVWGGDVTITTGSDNYHFTVAYAGVKSEDCAKLIGAAGDTWDTVAVGGTPIDDPTNHADVIAACPTDGDATISWTGH